MVDVTGPAATSDVTDDDADLLPADDVTFVHVSDVRRLLTSLKPESVDDLSPALPVVVHVRSSDTAAGRVVVQLMPSVRSLQSNEACRLGSSDETVRRMFAVQQKHGVTSVVFTRAVYNDHAAAGPSRRRYQLSVVCQPILGPAVGPFTVYLHVQLL